MANRRSKKQPVTKLTAEEIFDTLRDPSIENYFLADGVIDGEKLSFVCSERSNGDVVPMLLVLDRKAVKVLKGMEEELIRLDEQDPSDEDDEDNDEDGDNGEDGEDVFEP